MYTVLDTNLCFELWASATMLVLAMAPMCYVLCSFYSFWMAQHARKVLLVLGFCVLLDTILYCVLFKDIAKSDVTFYFLKKAIITLPD